MKRTKGIGPNNLGISKAAVKSYHEGAAAKKIGMGAETYGGAMANKSDYGDSNSMATFNAVLEDRAEKGKLNPGFTKAIMDNKVKEEKSSGITQTKLGAYKRAVKLEGKAKKALKNDNIDKNVNLVKRHNNLVDRRELDKEKLAAG